MTKILIPSVNRKIYVNQALMAMAGLCGLVVSGALSAQEVGTAPAPRPVYTSDPSTLLGPRSMARAGATVSSEMTHDALMQNPAAPAFRDRYAISLAYSGEASLMSASIVDTKSGPVGGGIYYQRRTIENTDAEPLTLGNYTRVEDRAGFALMGKVGPNFGVGANVKWAYRRSTDERIPNASNWNFDIGSIFKPTQIVSVGVVGQNLLDDHTSLNPKQVVGGLEITPMGNLLLGAQITKVLDIPKDSLMTIPDLKRPLGYSASAQFTFAQNFSVRAGYNDSPTWKTRLVGMGGGYETKDFNVEYAFNLGVAGTTANIHSLLVSGYF